MRSVPTKKNAGCPKAFTARFPAKKIWHSLPPVGLSWKSPPPPPESVRTGARAYADVTTKISRIDWIGYEICLTMVLRELRCKRIEGFSLALARTSNVGCILLGLFWLFLFWFRKNRISGISISKATLLLKTE